jgi:hypothetical protein
MNEIVTSIAQVPDICSNAPNLVVHEASAEQLRL